MRSRSTVIVFLAVAVVAVLSACTTFKLSGAQVTAELPPYTSVGKST
ncbi:MAG TPA: hypothetical protein VL354_15920 [Spirochaetia bacterium]|nr:hypothetical protein [Spirochaetia bacterium]